MTETPVKKRKKHKRHKHHRSREENDDGDSVVVASQKTPEAASGSMNFATIKLKLKIGNETLATTRQDAVNWFMRLDMMYVWPEYSRLYI